MLSNLNQNITPFTADGVNSSQQPQPLLQHQGAVENNRKRYFRQTANYSELAAVTSLNAALGFTFRMIQVAPVGFIAIAILNFSYFTITATNEKKPVTHILTGLSASGAAVATLSEPIQTWTVEQSGTKDYHNLTNPPQLNYVGIGAIALSLIIGLTLFTRKDS